MLHALAAVKERKVLLEITASQPISSVLFSIIYGSILSDLAYVFLTLVHDERTRI
jgi:hypothetical protein